MTKEVELYGLLVKLKKLDEAKQKKVEEILLHSKPNKLFVKEHQDELVLSLVAELREIQDQIDEIHSLSVNVPSDLSLK